MVRAGVVKHPYEWATGGYPEIQKPRTRYGIIDHECLAQALGFHSVSAFQKHHRQWIDEALAESALEREAKWSQSIAVGSEAFVNHIVDTLSPKVGERETVSVGDSFVVREPAVSYSIVASLIVWWNRRDMFTKEGAVTEVIPNQRKVADG